MRVTSPQRQGRRRGVILLVVLAMLTLLTVIGVTFVLYSDSAESTARIAMEGEKTIALTQPANWDTDELLAYGFGQLIYDVEDDDAGQRSGMRGHSLARDMYGYYYDETSGPFDSSPSSTPAPYKFTDNDRPFRGSGRILNEINILNFTTFFSSDVKPTYVRDPERIGVRDVASNPLPYKSPFNPPYTFADKNHVYLAKTDVDTNGNLKVVEPSFFRTITGLPPPLPTLSNPGDPYWTGAGDEKYTLRPRPANHSPQFPPPALNGDVRNLPWGTQNDSVWIDLGVPPKTAPNGKRYKPLFAFLAIDLDGRVNVNVHGNVHGRDANGKWTTTIARHASGQGWGPWEVNLEKGIQAVGGDARGRAFVTNRQNGLSTGSTVFDLPGGSGPFSYATVNYNSSVEANIAGLKLDSPLNYPGSPSGLAFSPFVTGLKSAYGQGIPFEKSALGTDPAYGGFDRIHGSTYHPGYSSNGNIQIKSDSLAWTMARYLRTPQKYKDSQIYNIGGFNVPAPANDSPFSSAGRDVRYDRLTTMSWDLDKPGVSPYFTNSPNEGLIYDQTSFLIKQGGPPTLFSGSVASPESDFDMRYRSKNALAMINRLNLNRSLRSYPKINPADGLYYPASSATDPDPVKAQLDRQNFATEIFQTLIKATGSADPYDPASTEYALFNDGRNVNASAASPNPRYMATRWLAQLAVNIVDNIDSDDVMTAFRWNNQDTSDIVFGHELSRVAINEVYAQVQNADDDYGKMAGDDIGSNGFNVKLYTEIVNPLPYDPFDDSNQIKNSAVLQYVSNKPIYKLDMVKRDTFVGGSVAHYRNPLKDPICLPGNVNGELPAQRFGPDPMSSGWINTGPIILKPMFADVTTANGQVVPPGISAVPPGAGSNNGFLLVGPNLSIASEIMAMRWAPDSANKDMVSLPFEYKLDKSIKKLSEPPPTGLADAQLPTLVLRRLADPGSPPGLNNPYIMVDFLEVTKSMLAENDGRKFIEEAGKLKANPIGDYQPVSNRKAYAKRQPFRYSPFSLPANDIDLALLSYAQYGSLFPVSLITPPTNEPNHTFWSINSNSGSILGSYQDFNNLNGFETPLPRIHLDRIVTSPTELMTTPFCRPHEYQLLNDKKYSFCSPWLDPATRLYRWLEFVQAGDTRNLIDQTGSESFGFPAGYVKFPVGNQGGRISGKMNINTVTKDTFRAMCDAQEGNRFLESQIDAIYDQIFSWRSNPNPVPFIGNAADVFAAGGLLYNNGVDQTAMRSWPGSPTDLLMDPLNSSLFSLNPSPSGILTGTGFPLHPAVRLELLNKVIGRMTTRSNCFAVWLTVGFFEVVNENGGGGSVLQPAHVLGKEMEPKIRRRFFCMVDRTHLERWRTTSPVRKSDGNLLIILGDDDSSVPPQQAKFPFLNNPQKIPLSDFNLPGMTPSGIPNSKNNKLFKIQVGSVLTLDPNDKWFEETVEVLPDIGMGVPGIICQKAHPNGLIVSSRGNPGPMPNLGLDYKIEKDALVVPFFAVLE